MVKLPVWVTLLVFLSCWPAAVLAQENDTKLSMTDHHGKLTLHTKKPCLQGPWLKNWRAATWFYQGKLYEACWRLQERAVVVLDADGDITTHNPRTFVEDVGV